MFGFHWPELIVILGIATIIFGPKRLPEIGGALGKGIRDFRKGVTDVQEQTGYNELRNLPNEVAAEVHKPISSTTEPAAAAQPQSTSTANSA
jgi:sec-independent protein translocase protein TatA